KIRNRLHISVSERFDWPDIDGKDLGDDTSCLGMRDHFGILADGTVVPCCLDSQGIINLGNVFEESIEDILSSPRATAIKYNFGKRKAVEELCRKCPYSRKF
ncbi:MAG: SPASM domain-containing protein, partial [Clostridia bacterium]|nr:SPASM domain-containing protein [Clostridia bacterium]